MERSMPARLLAALPDAVTAAVFLWVWTSPVGWREPMVAALVLVVLVELPLLFASIVFSHTMAEEAASERGRLLKLLGWGLFFGLFLVGSVLQFRSVWPAVALGWILLSYAASILSERNLSRQVKQMRIGKAALRAIWFVAAVVLTALIPLPQGGVTHDIGHYGVEVAGGSAWGDEPHLALAAGALYYAVVAWMKFLFQGLEIRPPGPPAPAGAAPRTPVRSPPD
jgi:hypothetical protein